MDHIAIIEGKDVCVVRWCKSSQEADDYIAGWLRDNRATRPYVRATIAKSLFVIEG